MKKKDKLFTVSYGSIAVVNTLAFLGFNMGTFGFPFYMSSIGRENLSVGLVTTAAALAALAFRPVAGFLTDRANLTALLSAGLSLMAAPCFLIPSAESAALITGLRALQGAGWSLASTACSKRIAACSPPGRLSEGIAYAGAVSAAATSAAPLFALFLAGRLGPAGMVFGIGVVTLAAAPFLLGAREGSVHAPARGRARFRVTREVALAAALIGCVTFCYAPVITFLTRFAEENGFGTAGFLWAYALATVAARLLTGYYSDRRGIFPPAVCALAAMAAGLVLLYVCRTEAALCVSAVCAGVGTGAGMNALQTLCLRGTPPAARGRAVAVFLFGFDLGMALGSFVFGLFADRLGFRLLYLVFSAVCVAGAAAAAVVRIRKPGVFSSGKRIADS